MSATTTTAPVLNDTTALDTPTAPKPKRNRTKKADSTPTDTTTQPTPAPARKTWRPSTARCRYALTVVMSALPVLSLFLSHKGGSFLASAPSIASIPTALALLSFALCACVLAISLPHLAWAIEDITKTHTRPAWLLAVAFDCSIVACELFATAGHGDAMTSVVMWSLALLSGVLNCWAFLLAPREEKREATRAAK